MPTMMCSATTLRTSHCVSRGAATDFLVNAPLPFCFYFARAASIILLGSIRFEGMPQLTVEVAAGGQGWLRPRSRSHRFNAPIDLMRNYGQHNALL
jgi:hypothetical protein